MENLYLIVGLGNPGNEYVRTRHNVGFQVVEHLAQRWRSSWSQERKFDARIARAERGGRRAILCQPQTYMNASGEAIGAVVDFYQVPLSQMLVVVDDADLALGHLRLKPSGGAGGHHGLESIERRLGGRDYARLRVGIGRAQGAREITGHVLGRFGSTEAPLLDRVLAMASDQAECWLDAGIQKAMNQFNGVIDDAGNEREEQ